MDNLILNTASSKYGFPCDTCIKQDVCSKKENLKKVFSAVHLESNNDYSIEVKCNYFQNTPLCDWKDLFPTFINTTGTVKRNPTTD